MAARKGCTSSQLALAWVHHQGTDVCPIPGTTKINNFNQNLGALSVKLTPEEMAELESYAAMDDVQGDRYHSRISLNIWFPIMIEKMALCLIYTLDKSMGID